MKTALILGVSGQDGAYLARFLLGRGYRVVGTSRDAGEERLGNLRALGIRERVTVVSSSLGSPEAVAAVLGRFSPAEVYNLSGQSSVGISFGKPMETYESIQSTTLNLLEAVRLGGAPVRVFSAGSSECFGDTGGAPANETTPFSPKSPYAVAKCAAFWQLANYREVYGLHACTGILFNHESPLRSEAFVTRKIVKTACRIAGGSGETLRLGNMDIERDWGWAPEYVEAMWRTLQQEAAADYVIATGTVCSLADFVGAAFGRLGLDWREHVTVDEGLKRPTDIRRICADPARAETILGWKARHGAGEVAALLVDAELKGTLG